MRRNAFRLTLPAICALLGVFLIGASGKADENRAAAAKPTARRTATLPKAAQRELLVTTEPVLASNVIAPSELQSPRRVVMEVTAYCPCKKCCGPKAQGITASGRHVSHNEGLFVAADTSLLPFHTKLIIPGYAGGNAVPVLDRGGAIKGRKLDVFFPTHEQAREWGRRKIEIAIVD